MSPTIEELGPDYTLAWPKALFVSESEYLLRLAERDWGERLQLLLTEAFQSDAPWQELGGARCDVPPILTRDTPSKAMLRFLVDHVDELPERTAPRPYWGGRRDTHQVSEPNPTGIDVEGFARAWAALVQEFQKDGYFQRVAP